MPSGTKNSLDAAERISCQRNPIGLNELLRSQPPFGEFVYSMPLRIADFLLISGAIRPVKTSF